MKSTCFILTGLIVVTGLLGCNESSNVTTFEAGVYKGTEDPLLQTDVVDRSEILKKRFNLVQTDR
jgi:hypothetical protein